MHVAPLIRDLAVILAAAGLVALLFRKIRQPVVLGYIVAGILVGPHTLPIKLVTDLPNIRIWAELGVVFLMFSLGLEFSFRKLASIGVSAGFTALFEVSCMIGLGYSTGRALGWAHSDSLFLAAMVSISSTSIILRAVEELGLKTRRFAEMIFAVLIVEDLVAVVMLVALGTVASGSGMTGMGLLVSLAKLLLVVGGWFVVGYFLIPRFVRHVGRIGSNEVLTIVSLALCLALVVFAGEFHYSVALGAFIMGSILAESTESHRIAERIEPLRDLFVAVFFVSVGMLIEPAEVVRNFREIAIISAMLVAGKIIGVTTGALLSGQTLRTGVQMGFGLAQIGEFSFIIAGVGAGLGTTLGASHRPLSPLVVAVSGITTFTTPMLIRVSHRFAVWLERRLPAPVTRFLTHYAAWSQARRADRAHRLEFYGLVGRWLVNGLVVSLIFVVVATWAVPKFSGARRGAELWVWGLGFSLAALAASPFIWAMWQGFRGFGWNGPVSPLKSAERSGSALPRSDRRADSHGGGTSLLMRLLTLMWIGLLSLTFFPLHVALGLTAALTGLLSAFFYRRLESSYRWFESQFLASFQARPKTRRARDVLRELAPWDAHLVRIKVHPNADIVGKRLGDADLKTDYGLGVVAIQRGVKTLISPSASVVIYPKDELLVLGIDEEIERAKPHIEKPPGLSERFEGQLEGYDLRQLLVTGGSPLDGKTIRDCGLRELYGVMVVGTERDGKRVINPDSGLALAAGDVLWLVGETERLEKLRAEMDGKTT